MLRCYVKRVIMTLTASYLMSQAARHRDAL